TSLMVHAFTSGGTKVYTNSKSVTVTKTKVSLKVGKTYKIKGNVVKLDKKKKLMMKDHEVKLRYVTSNKKIATVSKSGKITAKAKGSCKIYVIAVNGARKAITVTVK
ncbi:MAG: Ig-like domain-containing protein, partial [Firmicutes bacterium]|nr:Ig-like domain-containing protein [Bacillota bacterium]